MTKITESTSGKTPEVAGKLRRWATAVSYNELDSEGVPARSMALDDILRLAEDILLVLDALLAAREEQRAYMVLAKEKVATLEADLAKAREKNHHLVEQCAAFERDFSAMSEKRDKMCAERDQAREAEETARRERDAIQSARMEENSAKSEQIVSLERERDEQIRLNDEVHRESRGRLNDRIRELERELAALREAVITFLLGGIATLIGRCSESGNPRIESEATQVAEAMRSLMTLAATTEPKEKTDG